MGSDGDRPEDGAALRALPQALHRPDDRAPEGVQPVSAVSLCSWCKVRPVRNGQTFCRRKCRQAAHRLRKLVPVGMLRPDPALKPGELFAIADPPYLGLARRYYGAEASYAGEVDHRQLIRQMMGAGYKGWALCCSAKSLRTLLPMCPEEVRVAAWGKPIGVPTRAKGPFNVWEPLILWGGRLVEPGIRDFEMLEAPALRAQPTRGDGYLMGRKPLAFCAWAFDLLGMVPGDLLVDLFPGTNAIGRNWEELSRAAALALPSIDGPSSGAGTGRRRFFGASR
jgi:hypothetical protein